MTFALLESGAVVVALLAGLEMHRQQLSWRTVVVRSVIILGILTTMIVLWRGR
jgi:hypothetical protein